MMTLEAVKADIANIKRSMAANNYQGNQRNDANKTKPACSEYNKNRPLLSPQTTIFDVNNPNFNELSEKYDQLEGVKLNKDPENRKKIPSHAVQGASEQATVKTRKAQKVVQPAQPVAEKILLGWTIISSGSVLSIQSASNDYVQLILCS